MIPNLYDPGDKKSVCYLDMPAKQNRDCVYFTKHSSRRPCHHMLSIVQFPDVFTHVGSTNAGVALDVHVVTQGEQHLRKHTRVNENPPNPTQQWPQYYNSEVVGGAYLLNLAGQLPGGCEDQCLGLPNLHRDTEKV